MKGNEMKDMGQELGQVLCNAFNAGGGSSLGAGNCVCARRGLPHRDGEDVASELG